MLTEGSVQMDRSGHGYLAAAGYVLALPQTATVAVVTSDAVAQGPASSPQHDPP